MDRFIKLIVRKRKTTPSARKQSIDSWATTDSTSSSNKTIKPTAVMTAPPRPREDMLAIMYPDLISTVQAPMTDEELAEQYRRFVWKQKMLKQSRETYERTIKTDLEKEIKDRMTKTDVW
ncbi:MAG: hypothetical protein Q9226_004583 [Calogaya cf. arnoldii]